MTEKKPKLVVEAKVKDTSTKSFKEQWSNLTSGISKSLSKGFTDFSDNHVNLLAGINFSKQTIDVGGYSSPFNYNESQIGNNNFKPGFISKPFNESPPPKSFKELFMSLMLSSIIFRKVT